MERPCGQKAACQCRQQRRCGRATQLQTHFSPRNWLGVWPRFAALTQNSQKHANYSDASNPAVECISLPFNIFQLCTIRLSECGTQTLKLWRPSTLEMMKMLLLESYKKNMWLNLPNCCFAARFTASRFVLLDTSAVSNEGAEIVSGVIHVRLMACVKPRRSNLTWVMPSLA